MISVEKYTTLSIVAGTTFHIAVVSTRAEEEEEEEGGAYSRDKRMGHS